MVRPKNIGTPLVQLTAEFAIGYIKLKHIMTGHQCHLRQFAHIPGAYDHASAIGIIFYLMNDITNLVN
jgi:hypothetical protein